MRASASGVSGGYKLLADFFLSPSSFRDIAFCEEREEGKEAFDTDFFLSVFTVERYLTLFFERGRRTFSQHLRYLTPPSYETLF